MKVKRALQLMSGNDFLIGGPGSDTFSFERTTGEDWVDDFDFNQFFIDLSAFSQFGGP